MTGKRYLLLILAAVSIFLSCWLAEKVDSATINNHAPLKIGVASMITPVDAVKYYQDVIDYIGEQIGQPVQMVHRRTYDEMDSLLEKGEVKIAFICSAPYVKNRAQFGIELLAAPSVNGKPTYHSYIIVHNDSHMKALPELKGKIFAFTDPKSNTGKLYPTYLLKTMGFTPEKFFSRFLYSYSHNKSVEMVAKKIVDGAAVESIVYDHMLKTGSPYAKQTRIIKRSPPYGITEYGKIYSDTLTQKALNADATVVQHFMGREHSALDFGIPLSIGKKRWGTLKFGIISRKVEHEILATFKKIVALSGPLPFSLQVLG